MPKEEIIKSVMDLFSANQTEIEVMAFLFNIGYSQKEAESLIAEAKKRYPMRQAVDKLGQVEKHQEAEKKGIEDDDEGDEGLSDQEKSAKNVKREFREMFDILKNIKKNVKSD